MKIVALLILNYMKFFALALMAAAVMAAPKKDLAANLPDAPEW